MRNLQLGDAKMFEQACRGRKRQRKLRLGVGCAWDLVCVCVCLHACAHARVCLFGATPAAYGSSQARSWIGAVATATATPDLSCICNLHHGSWQRQILNPLSEARDRTHVLMDLAGFLNPWAMKGTPCFILDILAGSSLSSSSCHNLSALKTSNGGVMEGIRDLTEFCINSYVAFGKAFGIFWA